MQQRDEREDLKIALGSVELEISHAELRVAQARDRHGLNDLMEPAVDALSKARKRLTRLRKQLAAT